MGAKIAGIHWFTPEPDKLLPRLERKFNKQPGPSGKDRAMMALLRAMAEKNIRETASDEGDLAEKRTQLDAVMANAFREAGKERAVLVLRPFALSLYWYDQIRTDNLGPEAKKYAKSLGVPTLGLALYDDDDVILCASDGREVQRGSYWFAEDDIEPATRRPSAPCWASRTKPGPWRRPSAAGTRRAWSRRWRRPSVSNFSGTLTAAGRPAVRRSPPGPERTCSARDGHGQH